MQLSMLIVLAATMALAAIVDRTRAGSGAVELTQMIRVGHNIEVGIPESWSTNIDNEDHYLQAIEPTGDHRSLVIRRRDYLLFDGIMLPSSTTPIPFGELGRGTLMTLRPPPKSPQPGGELTRHVQLLARARTPDGDLFEIVLDSPGSDYKAKTNADDVELIKEIASTVHHRGGAGGDDD